MTEGTVLTDYSWKRGKDNSLWIGSKDSGGQNHLKRFSISKRKDLEEIIRSGTERKKRKGREKDREEAT